jgi:hypothetical protein
VTEREETPEAEAPADPWSALLPGQDLVPAYLTSRFAAQHRVIVEVLLAVDRHRADRAIPAHSYHRTSQPYPLVAPVDRRFAPRVMPCPPTRAASPDHRRGTDRRTGLEPVHDRRGVDGRQVVVFGFFEARLNNSW